ncbi:type II toxin-antitoxin system HicA family toxin [Candidatus Peregrinibacteria bacterium]|nr:type II toxin-antitoxin system HicA family toxin [Candidatus Peregrinibacteria bacterium]
MPKAPVLSGKKLLKVLTARHFRMLRQKGSHVFVESSDGRLGTVIPVHSNEDLGKGILKSILSDLELTVDDLRKML